MKTNVRYSFHELIWYSNGEYLKRKFYIKILHSINDKQGTSH